MSGCAFCPIPLVEIVKEWHPNTSLAVVAFEPLNPVTPGHLLVVPRLHYADISRVPPSQMASIMEAVSDITSLIGPCNVITSKGAAATQTVFHLHVHIVPRRDGDGLALPWTGQK